VSEEAKSEALEPEPPARQAARGAEVATTPPERELFTPELLATLRKTLPVLWLLSAIVAGFLQGPPLLFLVLAAGVLTLVIVLMWSSVQSLTGSASIGFEEALGMGAPSKVEEEKRAVLRALKDLEYERGVGKISPEDYAELSARYRAEAKRLIQSVDEALAPAREQVEKAIEARLARAGLEQPAKPNTAKPQAPAAADSVQDTSEDEPEAPPRMPENSDENAQPAPPKEGES
jgi:hypothetical protein